MYLLIIVIAVFLISLGLSIGSFVWGCYWNSRKKYRWIDNVLEADWYSTPCAVSAVVVAILVSMAAYTGATHDLDLAKLQEQRTALIYEAEAQYHTTTPDVGDQNLVSRVAAFNTKIIENRYWRGSVWTDIFTSSACLEVDLIPYDIIQGS